MRQLTVTKTSAETCRQWCDLQNLGFSVLLLKIHVFWDVTLCRWVRCYQCFEESHCLHHQGSNIQEHPWRKSHNDPLKQGELLTQRHTVIPHNTWILNHLNHFSLEVDSGSDNNSHSTLISYQYLWLTKLSIIYVIHFFLDDLDLE